MASFPTKCRAAASTINRLPKLGQHLILGRRRAADTAAKAEADADAEAAANVKADAEGTKNFYNCCTIFLCFFVAGFFDGTN